MNSWLYQFRMPTIAFVLGLFIPRSVEKYGALPYLLRRLVFVLYVYAVWYLIQMSVELVTSPLKNHPITPADAASVWTTPAHLWFIPYLLVSAAVMTLAQPWRPGRRWTLLLLLGITLLTWGWNPDLWGMRGWSLLFFTGLGALLGAPRLGKVLSQRRGSVLLAGAAALALFVWLSTGPLASLLHPSTEWVYRRADLGLTGPGWWSLLSFASAMAGLIFMAGLSAALAAVPALAACGRYIGQRTLDIYLAHVVVVAGARIILVRAGLEQPMPLLAVLMVLGVGVPLLLERITRGNAARALFEPPSGLYTRLGVPVRRGLSGPGEAGRFDSMRHRARPGLPAAEHRPVG